MAEHHLRVPLKDEEIAKLAVGDLVYFSGPAWTCRSRLQKYVFDEGHELPFSTKEQNLLIHVGPVIIKENGNGNWSPLCLHPVFDLRNGARGPSSVGV